MASRKKSKKEEIIKLIKQNPNNKDIIKSNIYLPIILKYINKNLFEDTNFCMELLYKNGMALEYMPKSIKNNKKIVTIAIQSNGFSLKFASDELKCDYDIVSKAILKYKLPLKYASENLQVFFKDKWDNYYSKHHENRWTGFEIMHNGLFTSEEKMKEIYEMEVAKKKKKKKNTDLETEEAQDDLLDDTQIIIDDFNFEENDSDDTN